MNKLQWTLALVITCVISAGAIAADKAKSAKKAAAPINDVCPFSNKAINASKTSTVKVGFCCGNCQGKFEKNPAAYFAKVAKTGSDKCPMSGKPAKASKSASVTVGLCCGKCKAKFDKAPRKSLAKVKAAKKKA